MVSNILLFVVCIALLYTLLEREKQHAKQVADLMDRAMAKDFVEYKERTSDPVVNDPVVMSDEEEYKRERQLTGAGREVE